MDMGLEITRVHEEPVLAAGERLSILKLLAGFMAYAAMRGKQDFPTFDDTAWHKLLFRIRELKETYPCFSFLSFNWNGPYPKCREFLEFNLGFSLMCSPTSLMFDRVVLNEPFSRYAEYFKVCTEVPPDLVLHIAEECGFWN